MTYVITHVKTNAIPDWTQAELDEQIALGNYPPGTTLADIVLPSDWNDDHTITGSTEWGEITGTLSDQTDLQTALNAKANVAGQVFTGEISATNLAITTGKVLTVSNSLTLAGTDGSTLNIGTGGTLGTAAYRNTNTSSANVPLLNGNNTHSGSNTFSASSGHFGSSAGTASYNIGGGATTTGVTKTIGVGANGLSGSITNINIGSSVSGSTGTTTIYNPTNVVNGAANGSLVLGADVNAKSLTAATRKIGRITGPNYTDPGAPPNVFMIGVDSATASNSYLDLGGTSGGSPYAVTDIRFYTAANISTTGGTLRMSIDGSGNVNIAGLTASSLVATDASKNLISVPLVPTSITVAAETLDSQCFAGFFTTTTGDLQPKTINAIRADATTGDFYTQGSTSTRTARLAGDGRGYMRYDDNSTSVALYIENRNIAAIANRGVAIVWNLADDTTTTAIEAGRIAVLKEQTWTTTTTTQDAYMQFSAALDGTTQPRMRLYGSGALTPNANDGTALGTTSLGWSDLFMATGAALNINNGNWVATHSSGILTVGTGDLRVTTAGTNAASVVTNDGTQTLNNKRINPRIVSTASSATPTPDIATTDQYNITALAAGATFGAPTVPPSDRMIAS